MEEEEEEEEEEEAEKPKTKKTKTNRSIHYIKFCYHKFARLRGSVNCHTVKGDTAWLPCAQCRLVSTRPCCLCPLR